MELIICAQALCYQTEKGSNHMQKYLLGEKDPYRQEIKIWNHHQNITKVAEFVAATKLFSIGE
jgi:hypothetical protein